jgi:hypothetical protein
MPETFLGVLWSVPLSFFRGGPGPPRRGSKTYLIPDDIANKIASGTSEAPNQST